MSNVSLKRRFISIPYDALLLLSLIFLGTIPFIALRAGEAVESSSMSYKVTLILIAYFFFVGFWFLSGRTLGMQSWSLRLINYDNTKPSFMSCTIRFISSIISWVPAGMGFWWQIIDKENLTWHDRISKTKLHLEEKK